jgi:hypothetical protein
MLRSRVDGHTSVLCTAKQADDTNRQPNGTHQLQMELVAGASSSTALNLAIAFLITPGSVAERISCTAKTATDS